MGSVWPTVFYSWWVVTLCWEPFAHLKYLPKLVIFLTFGTNSQWMLISHPWVLTLTPDCKFWYHHTTTTILQPFFRDHPGQPVLEESFQTLWCKGRLTEADTQTIRLGATPSGPTSAHHLSGDMWPVKTCCINTDVSLWETQRKQE